MSVRTNKGRKLKPTITATSNLRLQRDEPDPERGHVTTHDYTRSCDHPRLQLQHDEQTTNLFEPTNTSPIHTTFSHHPFTPPVHTICSHHPFTPPIHTIHPHHVFTPTVHSTYSQQLFTARIHSNCSQHLFTAPIHTTYSHRMFTLAQPTATSSRSIDKVDSPTMVRPPGGTMVRPPAGPPSAARRRTQPEKCGGKRAAGLRANGPTDVHRVLGADHESRSMTHE